jgi:hypothetical protein
MGPMTLNEQERRRPDFTPGLAVTMADGQKWNLPKPRHRFKPKIVDGRVEIAGGATFGPESDDDMEVLFGVAESDPGEYIRVKFAMAVRLLRANYNLSDEELATLIVWEPGDEKSDARWSELNDALQGIAPKPSPAT